MATTTVPAALAALVTLFRTAAGTDIEVHDGPPVDYVKRRWIAVGYSPVGEDVVSVVDWTQAPASLGAGSREERYDVVCSLGSSIGGLTITTVRTEVFDLFADLEAALRADPTLGGVVRYCEMSGGTFAQDRPEDENGRGLGLTAGIDFRVSVQARI